MHLARPVILVALAFSAGSCTDDAPTKASAPASAGSSTSDAARACTEFDALAAKPGSIEGLIVFEGTSPARVQINTTAEGGCGLDPNEPALTETWVVDRGRMANVFVWLANPPQEPGESSPAFEPVVLRQRGCVYRPHAIGLRSGQMLQVANEDRARHNVHTLPRRDENPSINQTQAEGAAVLELVFGAPEVAIPIVCDLHPWMKAWVGVFDHRFFSVTGSDGRFGWSGIPPGTYTVNVWHEALGKTSTLATVTKASGARVCIALHKKP